MSSTSEPPDITGFQLAMATMIEGGAADLAEARRMHGMIQSFVNSYRELDRWKLKNTRAQIFAPCEPVMHGPTPCIVLSVSPVRVSVRRWRQPVVQADFPMSGDIVWLDPNNLRKVGSLERWRTWCRLMEFAGQRSALWTTSEFIGAMAGQ